MQPSTIAAVVPVVAALTGCAPSQKPASPRLEPTPIVVDYRVATRADDVALLSGRSAMPPGQASRFSARTKGRDAELVVEARPIDDRRVLVRLRWREDAAGDVRLDWSPGVLAVRGETTKVVTDWMDQGRAIAVTVY